MHPQSILRRAERILQQHARRPFSKPRCFRKVSAGIVLQETFERLVIAWISAVVEVEQHESHPFRGQRFEIVIETQPTSGHARRPQIYRQ